MGQGPRCGNDTVGLTEISISTRGPPAQTLGAGAQRKGTWRGPGDGRAADPASTGLRRGGLRREAPPAPVAYVGLPWTDTTERAETSAKNTLLLGDDFPVDSLTPQIA